MRTTYGGYYLLNKTMQCLSFKSSPPRPSPSSTTSPPTQTQAIDLNSSPPLSQGNSTDGTPRSSTAQHSPTFNLTREYTLAVQTNSYNEIRSRIEEQVQVENVIENGDTDTHHLRLSQVLQPNRDCVHQALRHTDPKATLTRLVSTYFDRSENISDLCLSLYQHVYRARSLYAPITDLLELFPYDLNSTSQSQCNWAFDIFLQFNSLGNPFPCPDSHNFNEMRLSFSQLQEQLDHRLHRSRSRADFLHRATTGSAICLIGTVVGVAISAVVISTHALAAIVGLLATPLCPVYVPNDLKKKQLAHMAQLDAASKGIYVHSNDLDTIDRLVAWLYTAVENDRQLIQFGLERGRDIYPIYEVVKHLRNNHNNFFEQLKELEEHICLCFNAVNKFRSKLLNQMHAFTIGEFPLL